MRKKATVYILLAITFGYVLTSVVPSALFPEERQSFALKENFATVEAETLSEVEETASTLDAQGARNIAAEARTSAQASQGIWQYSVWIFDLLIALAVYFVARRKVV
jgi:hypothetical protein